jgi:hypothetical protein
MVLIFWLWLCCMCIKSDAKKNRTCSSLCLRMFWTATQFPFAVNHIRSFSDFEQADQEGFYTWISDNFRGANAALALYFKYPSHERQFEVCCENAAFYSRSPDILSQSKGGTGPFERHVSVVNEFRKL